ncbi:helix-turn-helix domain-containing protein [Microbacterium sp. bgisy203]|uniref:helix-turn-helix domain-containing protein n=1 Tax=Microbacterium sp. bgisy203 TaxID=3413799 RepID=UPI003D72B5FB
MLGRILAVPDGCLDSAAPVRLSDLVRATGLPSATAWRIAAGLVEADLLARTDDGYVVGPGLIERGDRAAHQRALRAIALPELVELHHRTGGAVWAVDVSRESGWTIIGQIYDRAALQNQYSEQWAHDPAKPAILATALGYIGLADRPDLVDRLLSRGVPRLTPYTETAPLRVIATLDRAVGERQLIEHGRVWPGWSCLAVPIADRATGRTVAVVGVIDRTPRFVDDRVSRAARATAAHLQSQWPATATTRARTHERSVSAERDDAKRPRGGALGRSLPGLDSNQEPAG